jgi:hypothetical protein
MYISDKLIFIELHKTASSHIKKILLETLNGESVGKHNQLTPELADRNVLFLGSVRNPYDWYLSLWGFGCDGKGGVFSGVTGKGSKKLRGLGWKTNPRKALFSALNNVLNQGRIEKKKWAALYKDVDDPFLFRKWLKFMNDSDCIADVGEGYSEWTGSNIAGLMTFRYLKLFCSTTADNAKLRALSSLEQIIEFERENLIINKFIRQESLELDMSNFLESIGAMSSTDSKELLSSKQKSNTSSRKRDLRFYYDQESIELVARREKMIIDKFGYSFPK